MDNKFEIIKILLLLIIGACMGMIFVRSDQATVNIAPKIQSEQQSKDTVEEEGVPETSAGETGEEESDDIIANINADKPIIFKNTVALIPDFVKNSVHFIKCIQSIT